jgi:hypothetical protein
VIEGSQPLSVVTSIGFDGSQVIELDEVLAAAAGYSTDGDVGGNIVLELDAIAVLDPVAEYVYDAIALMFCNAAVDFDLDPSSGLPIDLIAQTYALATSWRTISTPEALADLERLEQLARQYGFAAIPVLTILAELRARIRRR